MGMPKIVVEKSGRKAKKERAPRTALSLDEKYTGPEPKWDGDEDVKLTDAEFDHKLRKSFNYYNYFETQKGTRKFVVEWLLTNSNLDYDTIQEYKKTAERLTPMTICSLVLAAKKGMPLKDNHVEAILRSVYEAIQLSDDKLAADEAGPVLQDQSRVKRPKTAPKAVAKPTVRDRLNEIVDGHIAYFEAMEENFSKKGVLSPDTFNYLTAKTFPKPGIARFKKVFEAKLVEMEEAQSGKDKQLKEGYRHFKPIDFKKRIDFYQAILNDVLAYENAKKAARKVRVKKAPSKDKLVSKVKYMKQDNTLKVSSVNPVNIIGATEVWVFHTKYRKLGRYVADSTLKTMSIKGTTIVGFDEVNSVCKTLRKPEQQIAEFMKSGKVALRKFLDNIRATETKLTGRLSEDVLILKVV